MWRKSIIFVLLAGSITIFCPQPYLSVLVRLHPALLSPAQCIGGEGFPPIIFFEGGGLIMASVWWIVTDTSEIWHYK